MSLSRASVAKIIAAASIKVMDALLGLVAQNDAERSGLELLGRSWRRDWGMRRFLPKNRNPRKFCRPREKISARENFLGLDALAN